MTGSLIGICGSLHIFIDIIRHIAVVTRSDERIDESPVLGQQFLAPFKLLLCYLPLRESLSKRLECFIVVGVRCRVPDV
jgi:hypothetical protein